MERRKKIEKVIDILGIDDPELLSWINSDIELGDGIPFKKIVRDNLTVFGYADDVIENVIAIANEETQTQGEKQTQAEQKEEQK